MIKVILIVIAFAEVSRLIVDIINSIDSRQTMKQTLINTKNAVETNAENIELTKSYKDRVESFNNNVLALKIRIMNLDKRMKVLEKETDDVR